MNAPRVVPGRGPRAAAGPPGPRKGGGGGAKGVGGHPPPTPLPPPPAPIFGGGRAGGPAARADHGPAAGAVVEAVEADVAEVGVDEVVRLGVRSRVPE